VTGSVVVLGATGSIGRQTLEVAASLGLPVAGLAAGRPSLELVEIARAHPAARVAVAGGTGEERAEFAAAVGREVGYGPEAVTELAAMADTTVVNGIVGLAGLPATLAAVGAGNRLALANKESLIAAGPLVRATAAGAEIIPVDSEHSAVHQCLLGEETASVRRLVLTASGGPFRGFDRSRLEGITPEEALRHPNWEMGPRITVDSATLANKGLEVMEAHQLFDIGFDQIEVVVHPQSVVHSMVEFVDGSIKAQLGPPDMHIPIRYALTYPHRLPSPVAGFAWPGVELTFEPPDLSAFPALGLAYEAGRQGGSAPAVFNAADEVAVGAFLQRRLGFTGIPRVIEETMQMVAWTDPRTLDEVLAVDAEARHTAAALVAGAC
jgi:1-deoxy-D-xylulose-5-phosphate reductoisomerase